MPKLPRVTAREIARALQRAGFTWLDKPGHMRSFVMPMVASSTYRRMRETSKPPTLAAILKAAGISGVELRDLLWEPRFYANATVLKYS